MTQLNEKEVSATKLVFAINPVLAYESNAKAFDTNQAEVYLSKVLDVPVEVKLFDNYDEILEGMERGEIDIARLGPYAFAQAQSRFGARALVNAVDVVSDELNQIVPYRSIIFTRADSGITDLTQLKGKDFGFVDRSSTTGYLVATFLLQQAGLDPEIDVTPQFLATHRAVREAVRNGKITAGAIMQSEFNRFSEDNAETEVRVLAASPLLSRGPIAMRPGLAPQLEKKLLAVLLNVHNIDNEIAQLFIAANQRFSPAVQRDITLKTVAELAGVSYATVSRAINGRERIAPATTSRILKLVEELGYRPNPNARNIHKTKGDLIGLLLPSLNYPNLDAMVTGMQEVLQTVQMHIIVCPTGQTNGEVSAQRQKAYFELLYGNRLEGLILTQWSKDTTKTLELAQTGRPTVLLEKNLIIQALKSAYNLLSPKAQKRPALITHSEALFEPKFARHTFAQISPNALCFINNSAELSNWLDEVFSLADSPTGFICTADVTAVELQAALKKRDLNFEITGFGDTLPTKLAKVPSVGFDGVAVGREAAQRLLKLI
jgi:phosphonate transport system substrate-binding protein